MELPCLLLEPNRSLPPILSSPRSACEPAYVDAAPIAGHLARPETESRCEGIGGQKQIEDVQGIPPVGLLLSYPHRADLRRISHPKLVVIFPEYFLEPLRTHGGFYAHPSGFAK